MQSPGAVGLTGCKISVLHEKLRFSAQEKILNCKAKQKFST